MTPICTEHAALLRALARNTNDKVGQKAYADWLQERGNPGWIIVANYPIQDWFRQGRFEGGETGYKVLWLDGYIPYDQMPGDVRRHHLRRIKFILGCYANGKVTL